VGLASIVGKTGGGWLSDRIEREFVYLAGLVSREAAHSGPSHSGRQRWPGWWRTGFARQATLP